MSVKGDLAYQGLEQLLRADLASQGSGKLTLRHGAHYAALEIDQAGLRVVNPDLLEPAMVLEGFVERGILDPEVSARVRASRASAGRLLDQLLEEGALSEAQLLDVLALEVEDSVLDMLLWEEGTYRYETMPPGPPTPGLLARICVDPLGVAERALARIEERRAIGDRFGDGALLFEAVAGELPALAHEGDRTHEVYARVDGRTVVHEMALRMGISRFEVLCSMARLHDAGVVRPVDPDALARAATDYALEGRHAIARALVLQWAEAAPLDPSPLRKLASLAQEAGDKEAELEALCAQGNLFIQQGAHGDALEVFTRAMRHAPADDVVLAGLRVAAEGAGDNDALVDGTLLTAQTKLDEGEADAALEMLEPLIGSHPNNMAVHLLRARALVQSEKRSEFFEQAELVGQVLSRDGVQSQADREVAEFFRETIAHMAPDRGDLLERFRTVYDPRRRRRRTVAVLVALLLILGGAGVYLWPASASSLLARAQEAADAGDKELALDMIGTLVDQYPESPEAEQAYHLQARLFPPAPASTRGKKALQVLKMSLLAKIPALTDALPALPDQGAQESVRVVLEPLQSTKAKNIRRAVLASVGEPLGEHAKRLHAAVLERVQTLAQTAGAHERLADDPIGLKEFIDESTRLRDAEWMTNVKSTSELLYMLAKLHGDRALMNATQELARAAQGLDQAASYYDEHITLVRLAHAKRELEEADRRCREDAPKLMVSGHLDQADACYARLEALMIRYKGDDVYGRLVEGLERRQLPQLLTERRTQIADIRTRLAAAQEAEDAGDLEKAVASYAALVKEYWLIRFENVCTLPLRVESTPPGARVLMDGREIGRTPTIVRYAWGSETSIRLEADGFVAADQPLRTAEDKPPSSLHVALVPEPHWKTTTVTKSGPGPLVHGRAVILTDRRGILSSHGIADGVERWTRDLSSLEGVRARPAVAGDTVYVARVDGRVYRLDAGTGQVQGDLKLPRPFGDLATDGRRVAVAITTGHVVILQGDRELRRDKLDAVPTAGMIASHGAFWVGTAGGTVVRLDPVGGSSKVIRCARGTAPIVALAPSPDGPLVATADGALLSLAPDGTTRWKRPAVGDLVGTPARAGAHVAVVDRTGVVHVFRADDGTPAGTFDVGARPEHGIVAVGRSLLVQRRDGALRVIDPSRGIALVAHPTATDATFPAAAVDGGSALVPYGAGHAARLPIPQPAAATDDED